MLYPRGRQVASTSQRVTEKPLRPRDTAEVAQALKGGDRVDRETLDLQGARRLGDTPELDVGLLETDAPVGDLSPQSAGIA